MSMLTFLVDEAGDLWNADSTDFHHRLGVRNPDFDVAAFAVKNFRWVEIAYCKRRVTARLRPATAEPKAVKFLQDVLKGTDKPEILLSSWIEAWKREKFSSAGAALTRLESVLAPAHVRKSARFRAVRRQDSVLFADKNLELISTLTWFRERSGSLDRNSVLLRCRQSPTGLMGFAQKNEEFPQFHFGQIGENVSF